eukprot:TRINITY_DN209_c0_g1_i2.p1 TRINITY_DN209_c0_g1~~TRINITY_DN209_c0_g1_i2.p1  ORF type:complete len:239 (+),score=41.55 TRINITY_DN209_c0_g1_i2:166-882(+)
MLALLLSTCAFRLQITHPAIWPVSLVIFMGALNALVSCIIMRRAKDISCSTLPMVDLFHSNHTNPSVLDIGCGGGRTTVVLSKSWPANSCVTCLDLFTAMYIEDGGMQQLNQNLEVAGIDPKNIKIVRGDMTNLTHFLPLAQFDAAVSTAAMDHLPSVEAQQQTLKEVSKVLKPGGRFLLIVLVPGLPMFGAANLGCLVLTKESKWREMALAAGFKIIQEGYINEGWFMLTEPQAQTS